MSETLTMLDTLKAILLLSIAYCVLRFPGVLARAVRDVLVNREQCRKEKEMESKRLDTVKEIAQMYRDHQSVSVHIPGVLELDAAKPSPVQVATPTEHPRDPPTGAEPAPPVVQPKTPKPRKAATEPRHPTLFE
jgi:hypothetical protein